MNTITDGTTVITPDLVLGYEAAQDGRSVFHDVIGRSDPDVTLRELATRSGSLDLFFLTRADADAARTFHAAAKVFTYNAIDNPSTSMDYVVAEGGVRIKLDDATRARWVLTVAYREVAP